MRPAQVLFRGSTVPASHDAPSYAVVMTGHFVIDASTLIPTDATMHDQDDTGLLAQLGPVAILTRETTRPSQKL
jgi:hypothetical protein